jgi:hypothetical protein
MRYSLLFLGLFFTCEALAQTSKKINVKLKPFVYGHFGVVAGETTPQEQIQLVAGIKRSAWYAGVGVAIDNYHTRSVPVFLDIRRDLSSKPNAAFAYADFGYNCLWLKEKDPSPWEMDREGGLYYDIGLGYKTALSKKISLTFSAGFTQKSFTRKIDAEPWSSRLPHNSYNYDYTLNRIVLKAGLGF